MSLQTMLATVIMVRVCCTATQPTRHSIQQQGMGEGEGNMIMKYSLETFVVCKNIFLDNGSNIPEM